MRPVSEIIYAPEVAAAQYRRLPWRVGLGLAAIVLLGSLLAGAAAAVNAYLAAEAAYRANVSVLAETVARSVERPLSRAAEFGVPLSKLPDGSRFLGSILAGTPAITGIEVRDLDDRLLFSAGNAARLAAKYVRAQVPVVGRLPDGQTGDVAHVMVEASFSQAAGPLLEAAVPAAATAALIAIAVGLLAALAARRLIAHPALRALDALQRVRDGEIALRMPVESTGEFFDFWTAFRARTRRVGDAWSALAAYAAELEASDYENRNQATFAALVSALRAEYTLPYLLDPSSPRSPSEGST
ncbi:MAG: hypothetical protein P4L82_17265 [Ancalomicrobiaceae bacterium]|nr:hypothetical protein [Ancalomicrobiaceae bacterium]